MKVEINNLNSGSYFLTQDKLSFRVNDIHITESKYNDIIFEIDKKSALEITSTLLDSVGLLNKNTEELIELVEDRIEHL